ncbi:MAG TPA: hypothetical protein VF096_08075 [Azonexus sp.]
MTQEGSQSGASGRTYRPRLAERRCRGGLLPPPYRTADGLVEYDRRSHLDRRSAWIRNYTIAGDSDEAH